MLRHSIPTAQYRTFSKTQLPDALAYVRSHKLPVVLKADGLAAGKGVVICYSVQDAVQDLESMLRDEKFGAAGEKVVVEEFLSGIEVSVFALTDGNHYVLLPEAKDYKRIGENDTGLNTGGMGAVSPVVFADDTFMEKVRTRIVEPTVDGLAKEGIPYCGFLFFGLISLEGEPFVIEYNCRMGDPETEVVIPRINSDLVDLLEHTAKGTLNKATVFTDSRFAVTVVTVSGGYPGKYETGKVISGLKSGDANTVVFHAGTQLKDGQIVTAGGRVMAVTSMAERIEDALKLSYGELKQIQYDGIYFRKDIGLDVIRLSGKLPA
jgi:phosphoribosylamine--glycine ligase